MTLADVSPVVRDALAFRRYARRHYRLELRPRAELSSVRLTYWNGHGRDWPRVLGLASYVPDPPLPLPGGAP